MRCLVLVLLLAACQADPAPAPAATPTAAAAPAPAAKPPIDAPAPHGPLQAIPNDDPAQPPTLVVRPAKVKRAMAETEDPTVYKVVINHEEQYSIWPADRDLPLGWHEVDKSGSKQECLEYIENVWTDMRPLSLRQKMQQQTE